MKKILLFMLPIMALSLASCEKPDENNNEYDQPEEIAQGTIEAFATYNGSDPFSVSTYYICNINQLDMIATLTQQIHEACMNGNVDYSVDITNALLGSVLSKCIYSYSQDEDDGDPWLFYDIDPGRYIVVAEHYVNYDYSNVDSDISSYITWRYKYKEVQVESGQTTSVAFSFEDYIVY